MDYWNIMYNVSKMPFKVFLDFKDARGGRQAYLYPIITISNFT